MTERGDNPGRISGRQNVMSSSPSPVFPALGFRRGRDISYGVAMGQPDKGAELERVLASATDKPHVILLGGHPDPGIGSALAHKRLCERLGVSATIAHVLPLSRSENRALVKLLNVPMVRVSEMSDLEQYGYLSLVDASASETSIKLPESLKLLTVVDHHRPPSVPKAPFVDIRHDVGATCTIY